MSGGWEGTYLEGNREGGESLREQPNHGVEAPHDDREPCDLAVQLDHLRVLHGDARQSEDPD